jgi:two-component system, response regulator / RNA-binding antiterminator
LKLLLADDDAARARALAALLAQDPGLTVIRLAPDTPLADAVAAHAPDVILVDMARPDRDALEGVRQVAARDPRPVVLFVDEDDPDFMEEAIGAGVSSYNVLGLPPPDVKPILRAAVALFRRHQQAQEALACSQRELAGRAAVARAKALLMRERRLTEPQAHRWLQRQAMARGARLAEIAEALLRAADQDRDPGGPTP